MSIDEAIEHGKEQLEIFGGDHKEFIKTSIEIMRKYQKIEEAYKKYLNDMITNIYADGKFIKALKEVLEDGNDKI